MRHECNFFKVEKKKLSQEHRRQKYRHEAKEEADRNSYKEWDEVHEQQANEEEEL